MRRIVLLTGLLAIGFLGTLDTGTSAASGTKYWADLFGFPDCVYSCGNNQGHELCTCTTPADG